MKAPVYRFRPILAGLALASVATAQAADFTTFDALAAWQAAAGSEVSVQDFQGHDDGLSRPYWAVALDIVSFEANPGEPSTAAGRAW